MSHLLHPANQQISKNGSVAFEGEPYGANLSFFHDRMPPGAGPRLHRHPYPETWIVRGGTARMNVGDREIDVAAGDIIVVPAETPHRFQATGTEWLEIICIHPSATFIHTWLD